MRTTVDLPSHVLRAAKSRAATRGESLKEFLTRAVTHELGQGQAPEVPHRVSLPLIGDSRPGTVDVSNEDIESVFAAEEAEKYG